MTSNLFTQFEHLTQNKRIRYSTCLVNTLLKAGVHLRCKSEINIDRIFKERGPLRGLDYSQESLRSNLIENSQKRVHLRAENDINAMEFSKSMST